MIFWFSCFYLFIVNSFYAPQFVKDDYAYRKTPRGYHPHSLSSNSGWNVTSLLSFLNMCWQKRLSVVLRRLQNSAKINTYLRSNAKSMQGVSSQGGVFPHCLQRRKSLISNPYHGIFSFVLSSIHVDRFEKRNFRSGGFWEPNMIHWSNQHIFQFTKSWG